MHRQKLPREALVPPHYRRAGFTLARASSNRRAHFACPPRLASARGDGLRTRFRLFRIHSGSPQEVFTKIPSWPKAAATCKHISCPADPPVADPPRCRSKQFRHRKGVPLRTAKCKRRPSGTDWTASTFCSMSKKEGLGNSFSSAFLRLRAVAVRSLRIHIILHLPCVSRRRTGRSPLRPA